MSTITRRAAPLLAAALLTACSAPAPHPATARATTAPHQTTMPAGAPVTSGSPPSGSPAPPVSTGSAAPPPGVARTATGTGAPRSTPPGTSSPARSTTSAPPPGVCPPPPPPGSGSCPNPCTCPDYFVTGDRWSTDGSGHVVIHYRINLAGSTGPLTSEQTIAAITAAAQTWMDADPVVELIYDGTTTDPPALDNVVGFVDNGAPGATDGGAGKPFDIHLMPSGWAWKPCDPAHGSPCTDYYTGNGTYDLQYIATHEWGHVLGVGHAANADDTELTMYGAADGACTMQSSGYTCRYGDTLGYGDVLGERALYPTSAPFTLYSP